MPSYVTKIFCVTSVCVKNIEFPITIICITYLFSFLDMAEVKFEKCEMNLMLYYLCYLGDIIVNNKLTTL